MSKSDAYLAGFDAWVASREITDNPCVHIKDFRDFKLGWYYAESNESVLQQPAQSIPASIGE